MTEVQTNVNPSATPLERTLSFGGVQVGSYGVSGHTERTFEFRPNEPIQIPDDIAREFKYNHEYAHPVITDTGTIFIQLRPRHVLNLFHRPIGRIFYEGLQEIQRTDEMEKVRLYQRLGRILSNLDQVEYVETAYPFDPIEVYIPGGSGSHG